MVLLIHGGAGVQPAEGDSQQKIGLLHTLRRGQKISSAEEAVVSSIASLEQSALWNAGRGAVLAMDGLPRLDASLALSSGLSGAVGDLLRVASPIRAAQMVLRSPYSLLVSTQAEEWLQKEGLDLSDPKERITSGQRDLLERHLQGEELDSLCTVGAVALDREGRLAAGTSTGGLRAKQPGRIGDSAIVGAGTWCSENVAISLTGDGDTVLARSSAARIALQIERGYDPKEAIDEELRALRDLGAAAGCIVLLASGKSFIRKNCVTLYAAVSEQQGIRIPLASGNQELM